MNSLLKINNLKFTGMLNKDTVHNTAFFSLLTALLLSFFSTSVLANRPAMEARGEMNDAEEITPEAPSAVEVMMQQQNQQTQQTGNVLQMPPKEMEPGEILKIRLLDYPRRGMSMDKVQHEYGQPIAISDSIGKPPITRWTYNDRVVYFEYSTVLHVVAR